MDEFRRLENTHLISSIRKELRKDLGARINNYLIYFLAGIIIASPLPDEVGVSMLAGLTHIKMSVLGAISFIMNSAGIFAMLLLGFYI